MGRGEAQAGQIGQAPTPNPNNIVGGNPVYGGKDILMNVLANVSNKGLIPSIISGLGEGYMLQKQAQAANEAAIQKEMSRRGGQEAVAKMMRANPELLQGLSGADAATFAKYIDQAQAQGAMGYSNKILPNIGAPTMDGNISEEYNKAIMGQLMQLFRDKPGMNQTELENQYLQQTLPGRVSGMNAENQGKTLYAVPQAKANLQGKQLDNTHQGMENKFYPQQQQQQLQKGQLDISNSQHVQQEMAHMEAFNKVLQQMDNEQQDPQVFRGMAMEVLRHQPISGKGQEAALKEIDNMAIMKMESNKIRQQPQQGNPTGQSGGLGVNWR